MFVMYWYSVYRHPKVVKENNEVKKGTQTAAEVNLCPRLETKIMGTFTPHHKKRTLARC